MDSSLGTFGYRVLQKEQELAVFEVYYDPDGRAVTHIEQPFSPWVTGSVKELKIELTRMLAALEKPVLDYTSLESV